MSSVVMCRCWRLIDFGIAATAGQHIPSAIVVFHLLLCIDVLDVCAQLHFQCSLPRCRCRLRWKHWYARAIAVWLAGEIASFAFTPYYAAPEVLMAYSMKNHIAAQPSQDMWALGALHYNSVHSMLASLGSGT